MVTLPNHTECMNLSHFWWHVLPWATEVKGAAAHRQTGHKEEAQHGDGNERSSSTDQLDTKEHNTATEMKGATARRLHAKKKHNTATPYVTLSPDSKHTKSTDGKVI